MNYYIKLHCYDCENTECNIYPCGKMVYENSQRGCTRQVPEELYIEYFHNINELLPFLSTYKNYNQIYNEIINCSYKVYNSSIGKIITNSGKLIDYSI